MRIAISSLIIKRGYMLNQKQQEFVDCKTKKICLDGVPGSGKSHTLVAKLVSYVDMGIHPQRMMVCCFTNKATDSIRNRLLNKLAGKNMFYEPRDLWIGTIHSICYRIIREYIDYLKGYKEGVAIISWQKQLKIAEEILQLVRLHGVTPNGLLGQISFTKNDQEDIYNSKHFVKIQFRDAYMLYNERLKAQNLLDLDDLLLQCYELLKVPYVLKSLQNNFDCILVDEFQDVNWVQYKIFKTLADREDMHYVVFGDARQAIYEWRGARPQYLVDFDKDVKDSERLFLELNYRCPPKVIDLSEEIIKNIEVSTTKVHKAVKTNVIDIPYDIYTDEVIEAINVIGRIIDLNTDLTECAILHRKQRQSRIFEEICRNFNIPYVVVGAYPFYQRKEVKDCLSFIKLLIGDRNDNDIINVINTPYRGIGERTIEKLLAFKKPLWDVISNIESTNLPMNIKRTITSFKYMITRLTVNNKKEFVEIRDKLYQLLDETMYIETEFARESEENQNERRGNVYELLNAIDNHMAEGHSIYEFYDFIMDFNSKQEDNQGVRIMTMHASKGLEFNNIFVAGFCDEHFIKGNYDEEIRLLYVAVTRTKEHLYLSGFGENDIPSFVLKKCKHLITIKDHRDVSNKAIYGKTKELDLFSFRNISDVPRLES